MKNLNFLILFSFVFNSLNSQFSCGTDEVHSKLYKEDINYRNQFDNDQKIIASEINRKLYENGIYYLPVVVHIFHIGDGIGDPTNPSLEKINAFLDKLNKVLLANYTGYPDTTQGGQNLRIQLKLIQRDSNCNEVVSVFRFDLSNNPKFLYNGVQIGNNSGIPPLELANISFKDNRKFINLYLTHTFSDPKVGGFAYFPVSTLFKSDGIYIKSEQVHTGDVETMVHELGHFLGLYHTFEGGSETSCASNGDCNIDGDKICDTDPIRKLTQCNTTENNVCTSKPMGNHASNYMSYCDKRKLFTPLQKTRMLSSLTSVRSSLIQSNHMQPVPKLKPTITKVKDSFICSNYNDNQIQWYEKTSGKINGQNKKIFIPSNSGFYYCIASISDCNSKPSDTIEFKKSTGSVSEINDLVFITRDDLSRPIYSIKSEHIVLLRVFNSNGQEIKLKPSTKQIDLSGYSKGLYFLRVETIEKTYNFKLIND